MIHALHKLQTVVIPRTSGRRRWPWQSAAAGQSTVHSRQAGSGVWETGRDVSDHVVTAAYRTARGTVPINTEPVARTPTIGSKRGNGGSDT